jgi:prevent-host-death family protein
MSKTVSTAEAATQLGALIENVTEHGDEVIIERQGKTGAVLISADEYEALREQRGRLRRLEAVRRIEELRERVSARNADMTLEEAEAFAEDLTQEAIRRLVERGEVSFERDRS